MGFDGFLKVPGIPGPSQQRGHEDEIEVRGLSFAMEAPFDATGLARQGRAKFGAITFTKHYDMASPYLKKALAENVRFDQVVFAAQGDLEEGAADLLVVTLTDSTVTKYVVQQADDAPLALEEQISFVFRSITFSYDHQHEVTLAVADVR